MVIEKRYIIKSYTVVFFVILFKFSFACTTIIVGKNASIDHSIMIARNVDSRIIKPVNFIRHPALHKLNNIYKSQENNFTYKMPDNLLEYTGMPDVNSKHNDEFYEEAGFNSVGVGISGTETILSNPKTLVHDPYNKLSGIKEEAIVSVLLPQVKSARDGVILLGKLIEHYGSGEGFGVAFADKNEAWYLENAGGHGFVAVKIPDDSYFVSANQGRIGRVDLNDKSNVIASTSVIAAAKGNRYINFYQKYTANTLEDQNYNRYRVWSLQKLYTPSLKQSPFVHEFPLFLKPDKLISLNMVEDGLKIYYKNTSNDPYANSNLKASYRPVAVFRTQESHILKINPNLPLPIANVMYVALGMTALSIYVPFYFNSAIPVNYQNANFNADNNSMFWKMRKLQILAMEDFKDYASIVQNAYARLETQIKLEQDKFEGRYRQEYKSDPDIATKHMNEFTDNMVTKVANTTDDLINQLFTLEATRIHKKYLFLPLAK